MQNQQYERRQYRGGGTQIWFGQGCAARASTPLPFFKGNFGRKGCPLYCKGLAHFSQILRFSGFKPEIWAQSENWTHI